MTHSIAPQMSRLTPRRGSNRLIAHCDAINVVISNLDLWRNKQAIVDPKATAIFGKLENLAESLRIVRRRSCTSMIPHKVFNLWII